MTSVTDHVHGRRLESFCHQSFFMFKFSIFGRVRVELGLIELGLVLLLTFFSQIKKKLVQWFPCLDVPSQVQWFSYTVVLALLVIVSCFN